MTFLFRHSSNGHLRLAFDLNRSQVEPTTSSLTVPTCLSNFPKRSTKKLANPILRLKFVSYT